MREIKPYQNKLHKKQVFELFKQSPDMFSSYDLEMIAKQLEIDNEGQDITLVVPDGDTVLAYIYAYIPEDSWNTYEIGWLVVSDAQKRCGIGSSLMQHFFDLLKQKNFDKVIVGTQGDVAGTGARGFYTKMGFSLVGALPDYYGEACPKVVYFKRL